MYKVVRKQNTTLRKIADTYSALNYITKDINQNLSLAVTEANNHAETEITQYDRIYFVLEGKVQLIFDREEIILEKEDSCFISKETTYDIKGTFKAIIINQPAFGS